METDERARLLVEGPGGIMEMKQTIADKEAEISRLRRIIVDLLDDGDETDRAAAYAALNRPDPRC